MAGALTSDFAAVVRERRPLIDVRAPVEFARGAFPGAVNLPLMEDEERRRVGIEYKRKDNEAAVALGHRLVGGQIRERRVAAWCDFLRKHPDALLYCFRGGQRSQIAQRWIEEAGCEVVRLRGGYKAFRRYLIEETARAAGRFAPIVLAGRTGSGKTRLLRRFSRAVDLEGLAAHRGSSFGRLLVPQPTQISFENALAYEILGKLFKGAERLLFEDEGKNVGRLYLPAPLRERLAAAPLAVLEVPFEERVRNIRDEYVHEALRRYGEAGFEDPLGAWAEDIRAAMGRIRKRLGGLRHARLMELFEVALARHAAFGESEGHESWIAFLLREYYDPMYDYQIARRDERILFRGGPEETAAWLGERL